MRHFKSAAAASASVLLLSGCAGGPGGDIITGLDAENIKAKVSQICKYRVEISSVLEILAIIDPTHVALITESAANKVAGKICEKVTAGGSQASGHAVLRVKDPKTGHYVPVRIRGARE